MNQLPILYSFRRCPYAMRARMAIHTSQIKCELREVLLRKKPKEMISISPKGTVPVLLLDDGTMIEESIDIMKWSFSLNDPLLILKEYQEKKNEMDRLIQLFDSSFKNYLDRYKYSNRYENEDPIGNRDLAIQILNKIEGQFNNHNLLYGDRFSFVDMAILPFVRQFRIADTDWFDNDMALPKIQQWLNKFLNSDLYLAVMNKYKVWENNAPVVYFPK